jgi:hypothetical protein
MGTYGVVFLRDLSILDELNFLFVVTAGSN